ncbi:P-loop containing nucleoside triphosphate hydrolase [Glarea lozoyensis ATCC 20868]|uniref:p-loop containing nucleoside triphosphate hydrolase n=1 Tax=Glarea lozoyensis (strain ATCC 20868 / MF5171) TaxID=1116229 RepID=S3DKN8_GLAL2|nr:P-loop containing nucleoside triphosphate hydrolase [Glarea lozoyensis ATCC 20868]EPE27128.1 P-loop containing nucleoside triphosphate hydrolase [Glarea lozoyensis ATCC 20868]
MFCLPNEVLLSTLRNQFPGRQEQILALSSLVAIRAAPCRNVVLYGLHATGKTAITRAILEKLSSPPTQQNGTQNEHLDDNEDELRYAIIKSAECITARHLLEQTIASVAKATEWEGELSACPNVAHLVVEVGKMINKWTDSDDDRSRRRLVLVFDGIDHQREITPTFLPALGRMGEIISNLTIVYIVTAPRPNFLHLHGVPHIHFPSYTKAELLQIISTITPNPELPSGPEDTKSVWTKFCPAIYDTLNKHSGRDIVSFRSTCLLLWPKFIQPILDGTYYPTPFSRLLVANRTLFQNDSILLPSIIALAPNPTTNTTTTKLPALATQLPFHTRLLLIASYLASFNPPKTDMTHFMKSAIARRRKKGGGTALTRKSAPKHRKISRKLLGAQTFVLDRMLAIFSCLKEDAYVSAYNRKRGMRRTGEREDVSGSADIQTAIATLASLRLLVKMGAANAVDYLDGGCKYRVAVGWDVVRGIGRSVGLEVEDYLAE